MIRFIFILLLSACSASALDITHGSITWTITGTPTSGTYANGDYWVVGPVTITAISPAPTATRNGTQINHTPKSGAGPYYHGFDDRCTDGSAVVMTSTPANLNYNAGTSLPLVVAANESVISTVSRATANASGYNDIQEMRILTVVSGSPAANSFRPTYHGNSTSRDSLFTTANLDYNRLHDFTATGLSSVPSRTTVASYFYDKVWFEFQLGAYNRQFVLEYMAVNGYGKEMAVRCNDAAILLNLNYTDGEKQQLLIGVVQYGLDIAALIAQGYAFAADGGHQCGKLMPLIIAAAVLDDATLKGYISVAQNKFQEYQQTYFVDAATVAGTGAGVTNTDQYYPYTSADLGMPEWAVGISNRRNNTWNAAYRDINGVVIVPAVLARNLGLEDDIGTGDAFFGYAQRHIYYRQSRYANPVYYNGYDDGDAYGQGNTFGGNASAPFAYNDLQAFHSSYYLAHEFDAAPGGGAPDTTRPAISGITTNALTSASVNILWDTDEAATSGVDYGTTASYGLNVTNSALVTSHSMAISGLTPSTTYHFKLYSTDSSGNSTNVSDFTFATIAAAVDPAATPSFSVTHTNFLEAISVTITTATSGATIYYTLDNSTPTTGSSVYSSPLLIATSTTLRAIASGNGHTDSTEAAASYGFGPFTAIELWKTLYADARTAIFTVTWEATPSEANLDGLILFGNVDFDDFADGACIVRFNDTGTIDARNGGAYAAVTSRTYSADVRYFFTATIDPVAHTYSFSVTPDGGSPAIIATDYAFRTEQAALATIGRVGILCDAPSGAFVTVSNFSFSEGEPEAPPAGTATITTATATTVTVGP